MSEAPMVWGCDISKKRTGLAFGRVGQRPSVISVCAMDGDTTARAGTRLFVALRDLRKLSAPDAIYFERRLEFGFKPDVDFDERTVKNNRGIIAALDVAAMVHTVEVFAGLASIPCVSVAASTARKEYLGDGRLRRKEAKLRAQAMAKVLGWPCENDDEGDALCIWHYGSVRECPRLATAIHGGLHMKAATLAARKDPAIFARIDQEVQW